MRKLAALIGILGLLAASLVVMSSSAMAVARSGPQGTVVRGRLIGSSTGGRLVKLLVWPRAKVVAALRPGDRVPLQVAGSAITSPSGRYSIRVTSPAALESSADHGIVNLEVMTVTRAGFGAFSFPRRLVSTPHGAALAAVAGSARADPQTANLRLIHAAIRQPDTCGDMHLLSSYGPQKTTVGDTYSIVKGVTMNFDYGNGQNSSLGVGIAGSGGFSASGTYSISSTSEEDFPTQTGHVSTRYRTEFVYGLFAVECAPDQTQPTSFAGGATTKSATAPAAGFCVSFQAGSTFIKDTTSAYNFTGGVDISGDIGINLSAQTGYDSSAELRYKFSITRLLCGTDADPGGAAQRIVAGAAG
jgi:hypothetical protein